MNLLKRELTQSELERPYSKYYFRPMAEPLIDIDAVCAKPLDQSAVILPGQINRLFSDDERNKIVGWSILPDGAGYVSSCMMMKNVTPQMISWWFAWHPLESLRYMLWYPGRHFSARVCEEDYKRMTDPKVDMRDKIAGVTHYIEEDSRDLENLNEIPPMFQIHLRYPEELGVDMALVGYPSKGTLVCASPPVNTDGSLPERPRIMIHYAKKTEGGAELYSRFWMGGYVLNNNRAQYIGVAKPTPKDAPARLLRHCISEYSNLASFLPELYAEQGGLNVV